jgi:D-arabinono-1,4-lactone oxidase/FAD binding domain
MDHISAFSLYNGGYFVARISAVYLDDKGEGHRVKTGPDITLWVTRESKLSDLGVPDGSIVFLYAEVVAGYDNVALQWFYADSKSNKVAKYKITGRTLDNTLEFLPGSSGGMGWRNWAGNVSSGADNIPQPSSLAEVQALLRNSGAEKIRAFGAGHSFSPLVVANGQKIVDLSKYVPGGQKAWRWQKNGADLVSYLPAATWDDVRNALVTKESNQPRMYLSSTGALATINATGFVAAGCHGTGWNYQTVSDFITEIEFVAADGQVHVFSDETTPNEMAAARVNLGLLGLITKVTLRVEPLYRLHDEELAVPTATVMGLNGQDDPTNLHKLVTENEYVELFWFPGSGFDGEIWVKKFNRTEEAVRDVPPRPDGWIDQYADQIMSWTAENPLLWYILLPAIWSTIRGRITPIEGTHGFVAEAPKVLFYADQAFPILDLEVAIPIPSTGPGTWDLRNVVKAWYAALNYANKNQGKFPLTTCLHARFTKASQSLLSPAYSANKEDRVCWMEILSAYPKAEPDPNKRTDAMAPHLAMINEIMPLWIGGMNGRPHWGKNWQYIKPPLNMASLYPAENLRAFNALRRRLDPNGIFINEFLAEQKLFS